VTWFWARLRFASPGALGFAAAMSLVASVVLDRLDPQAGFLVGLLLGMAVGLAVLAFGLWQRRLGRR
jgi:hypothetical protein